MQERLKHNWVLIMSSISIIGSIPRHSRIELFRFEANILLPSYDRCVLSFRLIIRPIGFTLELRPELSHIQILGFLTNLCSISMFVAYILSLIFYRSFEIAQLKSQCGSRAIFPGCYRSVCRDPWHNHLWILIGYP